MENKFDESEAYRYIEIYKEWRKNSQDQKVADKIKEKLSKFLFIPSLLLLI